MEEKKKSQKRLVKPAQASEKIPYEKLNQIAGDLYQQNQALNGRVKQLQAAIDDIEFNKLSFFISMLFKVIDHPDSYKSDFVVWCTESIESALTGFAETFYSKKDNDKETVGTNVN